MYRERTPRIPVVRMVLKDGQTPCLALRDELAPGIITWTVEHQNTGPTYPQSNVKRDTHLSRTSNRLVIRPPATVSCMALFPKTNESLLALCTVTSTEQSMGKSQYSRYRGLRTIKVIGANLAGQDKSTACAAFQDDVALLPITSLL
jgi:hypothetical protein